MHIRDGREDDASAIRELAAGDVDPHHLLRERTVRVAVPDGSADGTSVEGDAVSGFLAYDARPDAVYVTRVGGDGDAVDELLGDAMRFAAHESLPVEAVVPEGGGAATALETRGFEDVGPGPRFSGAETTRYRRESRRSDE